MAIKHPIDVTGNPSRINLTIEQVFEYFPRQYRNANMCFWLARKALSEEEKSQLTPPDKCEWYLCHPIFGNVLENFPDYELHMVDRNSPSGIHNSSTDMFWSGSSWEV